MKSRFLFIAALCGAGAVAAGAFGAHSLKALLEPDSLAAWETAVRYHFFHVFALALVHLLGRDGRHRPLARAGWLFLAGICLFSGSLYLLSTRSLTGLSAGWLGPVTPLGGLLMIAGWLQLAVFALHRKSNES